MVRDIFARFIGILLCSLDERDIRIKFGGSNTALLQKCSPMLAGKFLLVCMLVVRFNSLLCVLVFGCVARCRG